MTLREYMQEPKELSEGEYYHIGSDTSFVCVVTKDEYESHIQLWNEICKTKLYDRAKRLFDDVAASEPWHETYSDDKVVMAYALKPALDARRSIVEKSKPRFYGRLKQLFEFVPFEDREVTEVYDRLQNDGIVISVTGKEEGNFWMRSEYEKYLATLETEETEVTEVTGKAELGVPVPETEEKEETENVRSDT